jgi:nucleoid-associated protein YgaU
MPRDARLGLVIGVGLVLVVAVFVRPNEGFPRAAQAATGNVRTPTTSTIAQETTAAEPSAVPGAASAAPPRSHTVQEGETLVSLAVRYYGDANRALFLFHANQDRLRAPDHVPIGVVLYIPELPAELAAGSDRP